MSPSEPPILTELPVSARGLCVPSADPPLITPAFARLLLVQLTIGFAFSVYFLLPKYLKQALHAEPASIGMVSSVALVAGVLASPLIGRALDSYGRKTPMLLGAAATVVTSLGMATVESIGPWLLILRVVQGVAFATVFNAAAAALADMAPPERLGQAMGLLGVASLATNAAAPALAEVVAQGWGWSPVFVASAAMAAVTVVTAQRLDLNPRGQVCVHPANDHGALPRGIFFVAAVMGATFGTLLTFAPTFALERGSDRVAGYFIGYTVGALIVRLAFGRAFDRMGRHRVAKLAIAGYGVVACATCFLRPGLLEVLGLGFGVAHGFAYPALATIVAESAHPERRGRSLTDFNAAFNGGAGVSLMGAGWLVHAAGYYAVFLLIGGVALLSSPLLGISIPARRKR